jgi:hypothetical protein
VSTGIETSVNELYDRVLSDRRVASSQSIMPAGLADNLTPQELRDLVAFLLQK